MPDLSIALIQNRQIWEDIDANLKLFSTTVDGVAPGTDLVVLPEMFTTGFTMNSAALAQDMEGSGVMWLQDTARRKNMDLVGSLIIRENSCYYNRLVWVKPDGRFWTYDKRHLFRMAGEHRVYTAGNRTITVDLKGWRLRPFVCYDLRFPGWTRNISNSYDVAVFIANWPAARRLHWQRLLQARAIENLSFVVGVNRVGTDGNGLAYTGDSAVIMPTGSVIVEEPERPTIISVRIQKEALDTYREDFPAWMDADPELEKLFPTSNNPAPAIAVTAERPKRV